MLAVKKIYGVGKVECTNESNGLTESVSVVVLPFVQKT